MRPSPEALAARRAGGAARVVLEALPALDGAARRPEGAVPLNALTVDVEDWYQSCVDLDAPISGRVVRNVGRLARLLDAAGVKATFFVQGRVAEAYPGLVRELADAGHEIQSHGHSHRPLWALTRDELRRELADARRAVEDACGQRVTAFRAPDFSIRESNLWALEALAEAGFEVDSSIFPGYSRRYGIRGWARAPQRLRLASGAELLEVPVAIWPVAGVPVPVAGGGYLRALPPRLVRHGIRAIRAEGRPAVLYCHPYELNPRELDDYRGEVGRRRRLSQGLGRGAFATRLTRLLREFPFGRLDEALRSWGVAPSR
ncbi:MAG: polysaccharide deacetylase family protein [Thermoleophilaceae bacterium]|nr:polysaccharide deacetylase family protein [Thermoleophilaceae bacterium]